MPEVVVFGISTGFPELSRSEGQIAHVLLTRSPLVYPRKGLTARLACVKHAASVRPEPGSNSPLKSVDRAAEAALIKLIGVSRQERFVDPRTDSTLSYQRNRRQDMEHCGSESVVDGALLIRSSTFSTLLSSQGSSAHRNPAFRPCPRGNLVKLTGLCWPRQIGVSLIRFPPRHSNRVESWPPKRERQFLEMSRQETESLTCCQNHRFSYQRNRRPRRASANRNLRKSDGYQTNSSTFGTLLSSQGSSAHRSPASRPRWGEPAKTYRVLQAPSNRFPAAPGPGKPLPPS